MDNSKNFQFVKFQESPIWKISKIYIVENFSIWIIPKIVNLENSKNLKIKIKKIKIKSKIKKKLQFGRFQKVPILKISRVYKLENSENF